MATCGRSIDIAGGGAPKMSVVQKDATNVIKPPAVEVKHRPVFCMFQVNAAPPPRHTPLDNRSMSQADGGWIGMQNGRQQSDLWHTSKCRLGMRRGTRSPTSPRTPGIQEMHRPAIEHGQMIGRHRVGWHEKRQGRPDFPRHICSNAAVNSD